VGIVPLGKQAREVRRHHVPVGLRRRQGDTRLEPGKDAQRMMVALRFLRTERQGYPYVELTSRLEIRGLAHEFEIPWEHAHHRVAGVVQGDVLSDDVRVSSKPMHPSDVTQYRKPIT